jgi:hypothetical protein
MKPARHVIVFVKAPRRGQVKTRLGRGIGAGAATAFYRQQTTALLRQLDDPRRWQLWLAVTPDNDVHAKFWPRHLPRVAQGSGDLGARMLRAFDSVPRGPALIIGSDIPAITSCHVAAAFRSLRDCHAVFGPASDGGYWLVGLQRRPRPIDPFHNVRWSSEHALADTLRNLGHQSYLSSPGLTRRSRVDARTKSGHGKGGKYSVALINELSDIDTAEDYWRWHERSR